MSIPYIYETLNSYYGDLNWWPADTPYEVMVGAVLTQNTAWGNVEKALANFGDALCPQTVLDTDISELFKNYHAMIVINGKNHCRKKQPLCDTCPLGDTCTAHLTGTLT